MYFISLDMTPTELFLYSKACLLPPNGITPDWQFRPERQFCDGKSRAIDNPVTKWHHGGMGGKIEEPRKRITARVSDSVRVTLEQAAELLGSTVNQFVVQTAYQEAQRVVKRETVIRLSQKDARMVLSLFDNPPKPNKRLNDAVKVFKNTVRAQDRTADKVP
jgi:uncharacterized protein (DUF1778 family)